MRVISGQARGTKLYSLDGLDTRPTTDRVKESMFSIIQFYINEHSKVLDLFAGSGALGIECLSRGAKKCVFTEKSKGAAGIISRNLEKTKLGFKSELKVVDFSDYLSACKEKFEIIFLDPPYAGGLALKALKLIKEKDILKKDGIIVWESSSDEDDTDEFYPAVKKAVYGRIKLTVLKNI